MYRLVVAAALAFTFVTAAPVAHAQASSRSYAPEDLRQLPSRDRIRVLESEYSEQSNGRRLPTDQRDFYLSQINSGWTFSRIKSDIAQSLRGSGGWNEDEDEDDRYEDDEEEDYDDGYAGNSRAVRCDSVSDRYRECRTDFRNRAELGRTFSKAACREDYSWGQRRGTVWVSRGCRAEFVESRSGWGQGRPEDNYSVTCSSDDDRYRTCAWQSRFGRPYLIETLSRTACVQGQTWGYTSSNAIWVNRGCRGRFAPRS